MPSMLRAAVRACRPFLRRPAERPRARLRATADANTTGAPAAHTNSALSERPGLGLMGVPGIGGGGLNRNERVTCFQRWISRYMVYQLHTQAAPLITATTCIAEGLTRLMGVTLLVSGAGPAGVRSFAVVGGVSVAA